MNDKHALSARVKAAFEGCYEGSRAAALSGVPVSTVYLWARTGVVEPSVSPTKIKLWSYADLMALRIVYWLRHPKKGRSSYIAASPMQRVRDALAELERRGLDIWDDSGRHPDSPLRVDSSANIFVVDENVARVDGQQPLTGMLDLLGPFESDGRRGPDLVRPRPNLRIIPGRMSGEPHLAGSRITTQVAAALRRNIADVEKIAALYPGFDASIFEEAIEFEFSLAA